MTLTHNGKAFTAEPITTPEDKEAGAEYLLSAPDGKEYLLVRNVPNPHMLFAIRIKNLTVPNGWWFTDKGGSLRSYSP